MLKEHNLNRLFTSTSCKSVQKHLFTTNHYYSNLKQSKNLEVLVTYFVFREDKLVSVPSHALSKGALYCLQWFNTQVSIKWGVFAL